MGSEVNETDCPDTIALDMEVAGAGCGLATAPVVGGDVGEPFIN